MRRCLVLTLLLLGALSLAGVACTFFSYAGDDLDCLSSLYAEIRYSECDLDPVIAT